MSAQEVGRVLSAENPVHRVSMDWDAKRSVQLPCMAMQLVITLLESINVVRAIWV